MADKQIKKHLRGCQCRECWRKSSNDKIDRMTRRERIRKMMRGV